jgi:hypothetical protein
VRPGTPRRVRGGQVTPSPTAVQVNDRAAADLEIYLRQMPQKVYYVNPCEAMPLERLEELAKMHRIVIVSEPSAGNGRK